MTSTDFSLYERSRQNKLKHWQHLVDLLREHMAFVIVGGASYVLDLHQRLSHLNEH